MFIEEAVKACYKRTVADGVLYEVAADFPAFKGHFEGHPLLPAVCQLSFCSNAAGRLFKKPLEIKAVKKAKFINPVLPGACVAVKLSPRPDGWYLVELTEITHNKKISQMLVQFSQRTL